MNIQLYFNYIFKYYRINKIKFLVSIICLTICYLALETVISFSAIIEHNSQRAFDKYFAEANFIMAPHGGIRFDQNGELQNDSFINSSVLLRFQKHFLRSDYKLIQNAANFVSDSSKIKYISIKNKSLNKELRIFCKSNNIKVLNSFYVSNEDMKYDALLYDVQGTGNRFTVFSFQSQISAFILGSALASDVGFISRIMFLFSIVFTFYISLLYFQERKNEFSTMIIDGHTDKNLKIIFVDCIMQNVISFIMSILSIAIILFSLTKKSDDFQHALAGLLFVLPYLPSLIIIQLLLLLNRSINYASKFK